MCCRLDAIKQEKTGNKKYGPLTFCHVTMLTFSRTSASRGTVNLKNDPRSPRRVRISEYVRSYTYSLKHLLTVYSETVEIPNVSSADEPMTRPNSPDWDMERNNDVEDEDEIVQTGMCSSSASLLLDHH